MTNDRCSRPLKGQLTKLARIAALRAAARAITLRHPAWNGRVSQFARAAARRAAILSILSLALSGVASFASMSLLRSLCGFVVSFYKHAAPLGLIGDFIASLNCKRRRAA